MTEVALLILFISITNPISAHLIAKVAAKYDGEVFSKKTRELVEQNHQL